MRQRTYRGNVGPENANFLAHESRTHWLAAEYRPRDLGDGWIEFTEAALDASRELGEEEDGAILDDADGLRVMVGEDAYELSEE